MPASGTTAGGGLPLTSAERRGRIIVVAIALAILLPQILFVVMVAARGYFPGSSVLLRFALAVTVSWCLYQGYDWARRWVPIVFFIEALLTLAILVLAREWAAAPIVVPMEALAIAGAFAVWRSPSVDAFLTRQATRRRPVLSLGTDDRR